MPGEKGIESEFPVYSRAFPLPGPRPLTTLCRIFPRCFTRYSLIGVLYLVPWYLGLGGPGMFECCLASSCTICKRGKSSPQSHELLKNQMRNLSRGKDGQNTQVLWMFFPLCPLYCELGYKLLKRTELFLKASSDFSPTR